MSTHVRAGSSAGADQGIERTMSMIILGVILLLIGWLTGLTLLYYIGGILLVVGIVLLVLGNVGRPVGGRKVWY